MAFTLISAQLPPGIDATKSRLAYGERALPKLNEELQSEDLYIQQKSLSALTDVLHDPEYISKAIKCSIVESLKKLVVSSDAVVRMKTTEAFLIISGHAIGRQVLIDRECIKPLAHMFDDECYEVRLNSHLTIEMISSSPPGPDSLVECGLIPILIKKLKTEKDEIKLLVLETLHRCMRLDHSQALEHDAMGVYTSLLSHEKSDIRCKAAEDIKELSFPTKGKDKACDEGCVEVLSKLLSDEDANVRTKACAALMVITITTRGKYMALDCRIIPRLLHLLRDSEVEIRLNALKLITTLSETPNGRAELLLSLPEIVKLKNDHDSPAVRKAAQIAEKTITWKP